MSAPTTELPKSYDPKSIEAAIDQLWAEHRTFHAEPTDPGEPYCIVIPPPNVTAALHLGHALNNTLQDILIRVHRMRGFNTVWMPGTDHAGIATQTVVEKRVLKEQGKRRTDFKRDEFVSIIQKWKDEYEAVIIGQLKAMGCSCDWDRTAFTMDEIRARAVREAFFQLFKDGLIYRGKRLVNWDPATQTALADDEVEMEEVDGHFYYLRYPLDDGSGTLTVATTRPETMLGDTAVGINPKDPRAAALRGKKVRLPIVNRIIPIVEDDYVVMPDPNSDDPKAKFATGFLKVTPAHDQNDYELGQRHKLEIINFLAPDGSISDKHGWSDKGDADFLIGLDRYEARKAVVEWFRQNKLLEDVKPYRHSVGHSYRSHVPIEPYLSDQWYCKVTDDRLRGAALRAIAPDQRDEMSRDREGAESSSATHNTPNSTPLPNGRGSENSSALGYFITFTTYGTWLHGDERGSADREHNAFGAPYLIGDENRERREFDSLKYPPMELDQEQRRAVQDAIIEVCVHRNWELPALHVRPRHVHSVVLAPGAAPEKIMNDFKAYATRKLRERGLVGDDARVWTRHGSTRYLFHDEAVERASGYVIDEQGAVIEPVPVDARHLLSRDRKGAGSSIAPDTTRDDTPLPDGRGSVTSRSVTSRSVASRSVTSHEGTLTFFPARYAKTFQSWHENLRDWCISRQLWWGHRIPVWSKRSNVTDYATADFADLFERLVEWERVGRIALGRRGTEDATAEELTDLITSENAFLYVCVRKNDDREVIDALESGGFFTQDPDVLDTWFSSGLWPMSTLGWPESTAELQKWNPGAVLTTAREIITLWVSRMVMFNLYFLNRLPFNDVYIHSMIQDGEGRKMSKSLGNGVDPLDIIHSHGTDAMRFTLASMATNTQDVRVPVEKDPTSGKNTSPRFDLGRNFCNKLWNAARFVMMQLEAEARRHDGTTARSEGESKEASVNSLSPPPASSLTPCLRASVPSSLDETKLSMADRWIVSRFNRTVAECNDALANYRFDQYAKACYDYFWRDFCDWYVEASKPAMKNPERAGRTAQILAATLDGSLRLLHPLVPFVTEQIWQRLNAVRTDRNLPGRIDSKPSELLIRAKWPGVGDYSQAAEHIWPRIQEVVIAIRNARNDYKVDPKKPVTVSIKAPLESTRQIDAHRAEIEILATCRVSNVGPDVVAPMDSTGASASGCEIFLEGLVDKAAEAQRNTKRADELNKLIAQLKGRLSNEGYIAKAPQKLVDQTKQQLADAEAELTKLS